MMYIRDPSIRDDISDQHYPLSFGWNEFEEHPNLDSLWIDLQIKPLNQIVH